MQKKPTLKELRKIIVPKIADIWDHFATQLNIPSEEIAKIKKNRPETSVQENFIEILRIWLNRNTASDSEKADELIEAVESIGLKNDALEFKKGQL